jgi:hypothetical protein
MGQKEKLIERLKSHPKDFTFDDAETLLRYFTYQRSNSSFPRWRSKDLSEFCL